MKEVSYGEDHAVQKTATGLFAGARFTGAVAVSFWIFNALYAVIVTLVGGPLLISSLWDAVQAGNAPWHHLGVVALAMLVPLVCVGFAVSALSGFCPAWAISRGGGVARRDGTGDPFALGARMVAGVAVAVCVDAGCGAVSGVVVNSPQDSGSACVQAQQCTSECGVGSGCRGWCLS